MNLPACIERIDKKTASFRQFPGPVRTMIVGFLKCDGELTEELAARLGVKPSTIYYHWQKYQEQIAANARRHGGRWIGRLIAKAEHLYKSAKACHKLELCWKIEKELIEKLIEMEVIEVRERPANIAININMNREQLERDLKHDLSLLETIEKDGRFGIKTGDPGGTNGDSGGQGLPEAPTQRSEPGEGESVPGGKE